MKNLLVAAILLISHCLRAQSLTLQERGTYVGIKTYGVLVDGRFVGTVAGSGGDLFSLEEFDSSIGVYSKIYARSMAGHKAQDVSAVVAAREISNLISFLRPCIHFARDEIESGLWFSGEKPKGIGVVASEDDEILPDSFRLDPKELKMLQDVVSRFPVNRESTFRWLAYSSLSRDLHVWDFHLSSDFKELVWIRSRPLEEFLAVGDDEEQQGEQNGADQPATAQKSKPEGKEEPKSESEPRPE